MVNSGGTGSNQGMPLEKTKPVAVCSIKKKLAEAAVVSISNHLSEAPPEISRKRSEPEPVEATVVQPKEEVETGAVEDGRDWDDPIACQLEELLLSYLQAIFQSAIKRITECGYSEEVAVKAVSRGGLYVGGKDSVLNIVNDTLEFLKGGKDTDVSRENEFDNLQHVVEYTMLEMISVLREVRPSLSVAEAMWWLLICDLNILLACTMEGDLSSVLAFDEASSESSSDSSSSQLKSEANTEMNIPNPSNANSSKPSLPNSQNHRSLSETLKFGSFPNSANPETAEGKEESLSSMLDSLEKCLGSTKDYVLSSSQTSTSEEKSGAVRKGRTKAELAALRKRSFQMERNYRAYRSKGGFKSGKLAAFGSFVMEKRPKPPSDLPGVRTKDSSSKVTGSSARGCSSTVPSKGTTSSLPSVDTKQKQKSDSEEKSDTKTPVSTSVPPKTIDYCAGIPYNKSLGKYVPQDKKDELILKLVSRLQKLQDELQSWTEWANEKVMQVSRRLGKERPELKALRQEKEEAGKFEKEKQVVEENTMKRLFEMEHALNNASSQVESANSTISRLQVNNSTLKKQLSSAKIMAIESAANLQEALERENKALKKVQAWEGQKGSLQEELETKKNKVAALQQDLGKAKNALHQIEARWKREIMEKETILAQADSMRNEREQREALTQVEEAKIKHKAEDDMQKYVEEIKLLESKLSELQTKSDSSRIAALRRDAAGSFGACLSDRKNVKPTKGSQSSTSFKKLTNSRDHLGTESLRQDRECVMCLSEEMSVVFLPCAHQVVCAKCNELHLKQGMKDCPSCRALIQRRIKVQYARP
ncbi:putative E3 ubiquitin-protein ligase RF298 isoform X1 [Rosa rugosa]|uniref:putative E3 ubiquitin-protein ligase RF298 isoform X1 n=2 Tax=Rosa rugosa TaxID=74645 RepID=UPI002B409ADB|nr:putative E3 ubiquitin-protein ligase RF298 isoform X1 [Rosa rugosa]XP_062022894.1 putative E3 ubiquitin-protein ligase RF298 isoform X1 [Rosa rugosa]XP_062022895.1 putative E3 ubiquitin-protein ligase RF298 isoform X1 [Rosa rugosa]